MREPISRKRLVAMSVIARSPFLSDDPWTLEQDGSVYDYYSGPVAHCRPASVAWPTAAANGQFIASSKTDWPASVREVEMLRVTLAWKMGWLTPELAARMLLTAVADLSHYWMLLFGDLQAEVDEFICQGKGK